MNKYSNFPFQLSAFSKHEKWYLLFITIIGAIVRIIYLYNKPFFGDEVGTLIYLEKDIPYLLSHFTTWLSLNYFIVLEKLVVGLFGKGSFSLGFIPLAAGIFTIPLTAILAIRFTSSRVAIVAATLVSMNPYLIQYSGIIRSYSLLVALSILVMILFFEWRNVRTYKNGIIVGIGCYFLILVHPNGVYAVAYLLFIVGIGFFHAPDRKKYMKGTITLLLPLSISLLFVLISYIKIFPEMLRSGRIWHDTPPTSISYIPYIFTQYFSGDFYGWLSVVCFITGVFVSYKYVKPIVLLIPAIFLPILLMSVQGLSHFPWAYARFLIFIVPIIILFIAEGIHYYSSKYFSGGSQLSTIGIVILIILSWAPQIATIFNQKNEFPWHNVAHFIKNNLSKGDIILGSAWIDRFHLLPYLPEKSFTSFQLTGNSLRHAALGPNSTAKIFFVTSAHFVKTTYPTYYSGKIQVIISLLSG